MCALNRVSTVDHSRVQFLPRHCSAVFVLNCSYEEGDYSSQSYKYNNMGPRYWTDDETSAFVGFMEELMNEGRRAENGQFKPGSFERLAMKMNARFPGCEMKANHCKNKHKRLKEKYQWAYEMQQCSGFGWDDEKQCVVVDSQDVLDAWLKGKGKSLYQPGKPLPHYHRLANIFGRDRANGTQAEDGNDMNEQVTLENGTEDDDIDDNTLLDDDNTQHHSSPSINNQPTEERVKRRKTIAPKITPEVLMFKEFSETVSRAFEQQGKRLEVIGQALVGSHSEKVTGKILTDLGFSNDEVVLVALKFSENRDLERLFWNLEDVQRVGFIKAIIQK